MISGTMRDAVLPIVHEEASQLNSQRESHLHANKTNSKDDSESQKFSHNAKMNVDPDFGAEAKKAKIRR